MRRTTTDRTRSHAPRTAFLVGAAIAAPMAAVGVANAAMGPSGSDDPADAGVAPPVPEAAGVDDGPSAAQVAAAQAFWDAGYLYCDAEALAAARGVDVWELKVALGGQLLAGEAVDPPSGCTDAEVEGADPALLAFWDNGYRYCDAVALADAMGSEPFEVKLAVGAALVAGEPVPAPPSGCAD